MSVGSGKHDNDAKTFVHDNKKYVSISEYQKQQLLAKTIPEYENRIKRSANFPVTQYQFDALVSLAYDSGRHLSRVPQAIAAGRLIDAEKDWLSRTSSEGVYKPGLANRRKLEVELYNTGKYN